jgi:hypothetical protein
LIAVDAIASVGKPVEDPQKYVLKTAEFPDRGLEQFSIKLSSVDALFVAPVSSCGNAGCDFALFLQGPDGYSYVTNLFLHPKGFRVLESKHHGLPDILSYQHMSTRDGNLVTYEFDGKSYKAIKERRIPSASFESTVKPVSVNVEYFTKELHKVTEAELSKSTGQK